MDSDRLVLLSAHLQHVPHSCQTLSVTALRCFRNGTVSQAEFVKYFAAALPEDAQEFDAVIRQFLEVAQKFGQSGRRAESSEHRAVAVDDAEAAWAAREAHAKAKLQKQKQDANEVIPLTPRSQVRPCTTLQH